MRVLLTRPREDSERLAQDLRARGNEVVIEPLLRIVPVGSPPTLDDVAALVVTSANGIRAFAALCARRDLTVYSVGDATALAAREAGFTHAESAAGDAAALEALVSARARPSAGTLLHVQGRTVAGRLDEQLKKKGFTVRPVVLYEAQAADELSMTAHDLIAHRKIDAVLFFSPRTARTFVRLVRDAGLADRCDTEIAICLSTTVAQAVSGLIWQSVQVAATPDRAAMLQLCEAVQESRQT